MDNKSITKKLKLTIQLMELHEENPFKIRSYQSALNTIDRGDLALAEMDPETFQDINGIGKSIAEVLKSLLATGSFPLLDELLEKTPNGLLEVMALKGLGPKKIKVLWKDLGITSTHELMEACQSDRVAQLKGFGTKTQETIMAALEYKAANAGKYLYAEIEHSILEIEKTLKDLFGEGNVHQTGDFARKLEIISEMEWLIQTDNFSEGIQKINGLEGLKQDFKKSSPFTWRGTIEHPELTISLSFNDGTTIINEKLIRSSSTQHLHAIGKDQLTMAQIYRAKPYFSEEEAYQEAGMQYIPAELREGVFEVDWAKENKIPRLLDTEDLKGVLHNHSTYSDGKHSLREMAVHCRDLGYQYLGISDHSQSAFYAGGLDEAKVRKQHQEIDQLNEELAPFRIFKGIESDILADGRLDYPDEVLASFDFIVSSVHSILNMDLNKATARLIKAVKNPYTTILGHPTGRLLLRREGYPIDHKAVIDACAEHQVAIEINANPWRLDLDWKWVNYALSKGVHIAINPDAHDKNDYSHMRYGVLVGRKGGLTKEMTLNSMDLKDIQAYFENRKSRLER